MRRFLLLTTILLLIVTVLHSPAVRTQEPEKGLPNPADYPAAGANCKRRVSLSPWVGTPAVEFPKTFQCELSIHTCDGVKTYKSGVRASGVGMCADYWAVHDALRNRELCCDSKLPSQDSRPRTPEEMKPECKEQKTAPWFDTEAKCDDPIMFPPSPSARAEPSLGGVTCRISYTVCGYLMSEPREEYFSTGLLNSYRRMSQEEADEFCTAKGFGRNTVPYRLTCCKKMIQAFTGWIAFRRQHGPDAPGQPCNPSEDADCDGTRNLQDPTPLGDCAKYPGPPYPSP